MAMNTLKCNHFTPMGLKGLRWRLNGGSGFPSHRLQPLPIPTLYLTRPSQLRLRCVYLQR